VVALSRHGGVPLGHAPGAAPYAGAIPLDGGPLGLLRALRRAAAAEVAAGRPWQPVIDALRPHSAGIWAAWSEAERASFLRHAMPAWNVHRHRAPDDARVRVAAAQASGRLDFVRGHLAEVAPAADGVRVRLRARGPSRALTTFQARWLVLATGPGPPGAAHDPLLGELVVTGLATTDASGLGVHTDARGDVLDPRGRVQAGLHALGPVRRGEGPETTALREIRAQAAALAERVGAEARATAVTGVAQSAGGPGAAR
jgi:uncharacterized NAD(P)/FAD-binding protein YdhS